MTDPQRPRGSPTTPPSRGMGPLAWTVVASLYVATMAAVVLGMGRVRTATLATLAGPEARQEWQDFRDAAAEMSIEGPVRRRVPTGAEPPALRLMRDHFGVCLAAALFFSSALFAALVVLVRGAFSRVDLPPPSDLPPPGDVRPA